jgi:hypothetical protein
LSTTVLRSVGGAAFNPRPTSYANRRTAPILATSGLCLPSAETWLKLMGGKFHS